jgi:hypothetical protein
MPKWTGAGNNCIKLAQLQQQAVLRRLNATGTGGELHRRQTDLVRAGNMSEF